MFVISSAAQGGRHVDYVADQVVGRLIEVVKKKNKAGVAVKPFQVQFDCSTCSKIFGYYSFIQTVCY